VCVGKDSTTSCFGLVNISDYYFSHFHFLFLVLSAAKIACRSAVQVLRPFFRPRSQTRTFSTRVVAAVGVAVDVAVGAAVGVAVGVAVGAAVGAATHFRSVIVVGGTDSTSLLSHSDTSVQYLFEVGVGAVLCQSVPKVQVESKVQTASFISVPSTEAYSIGLFSSHFSKLTQS